MSLGKYNKINKENSGDVKMRKDNLEPKKTGAKKSKIIEINFGTYDFNNGKGPQPAGYCSEYGIIVKADYNGAKTQTIFPQKCIFDQTRKPLFVTKMAKVFLVQALPLDVDIRQLEGIKIVTVESTTSIDYTEIKKHKVVVMFKEKKCHLIWISDQTQKKQVLQELNIAEKSRIGAKNPWIKNGGEMLKPPAAMSSIDKNDIAKIINKIFDKPLSTESELQASIIIA